MKALELAQKEKYDISGAEIGRRLGKHPALFRRWTWRYPGFVRWWYDEAELFFQRRLPAVYAQMFLRATGKTARGSYHDAKLILERFDRGYMPRSAQVVAAKIAHGKARPADLEAIDQILAQAIDGDSDTQLEERERKALGPAEGAEAEPALAQASS